MIEVIVTDSIIDEATHMADAMGKLNNSITKGDGNIAGFIGEIVVRNYLNAQQANTYDYDLILDDGLRVDVKTKRTGVKPMGFYDCSVAELSLHQDCDAYAFCRVKNDYNSCWFIGLIPHDRYFEISRYLKKGEIDRSNNYTVKSSCYNVEIDKVEDEDISFRYRD